MEPAPYPGSALDPYTSAHSLDEPRGDGEPQPSPAILTRGRSVYLRERQKDGVQPVGGNTDARVRYGDMNQAFLSVACRFGDMDRHFAFFRELDCISDEIDQDLAEPGAISPNKRGDFRSHFANQFQSFFIGAKSHGFQRQLHGFTNIEIRLLEGELASLDFGEIENVLDHRQKRVR